MHALPRPARLLLLAGLLFSACGGGAQSQATQAGWRRALERAPGLEIQVGELDSHEELQARLLAAAHTLASRQTKSVTVGPVGAGDERLPRIVLGRPADPAIAALLRELGGEVLENDLRLGPLARLGPNDLLHLCVADPERPGLPLQLYLAQDFERLLDGVEDLTPGARPGATVVTPRQPALRFDPGAGAGPTREPAAAFDFAAGGAHFALLARPGVDPKLLERYAGGTRGSLRQIAEWTGATPRGRLELLAVDSVEDLRRLGGSCDLVAADGSRSRRIALLARGMPDDHGAAAARWAAAQSLGARGNWWLDGSAVDAAGWWWGRRLEAWGGHLVRAGLVPEVDVIVADASVDRLSQHILAPARALLSRYLRVVDGTRWLRLWRGEESLLIDDELRRGFEVWLAGPDLALGAGEREELWRKRRAELVAGPYQNGVAIDSNGRPGGGFDGAGLAESLQAACALGADALSLTSYFTEVAPPRAIFGGRVPPGRTALEGDAALAQACAMARRAGARRLLLQPHLLLSESAGHSAWLRRTTPEHWREFFDELEPMLVHYALLAELCDVDLLCLGTALTSANSKEGLDAPTKAFHDQGWATAIDLARAAYGGCLTYAASVPGEAQGFPHWERLDFIGVSLFPRFGSLREAPLATNVLRRRWQTLLETLDALSQRHARPALIVEMGLRSTALCGTETSVATGRADLDEQVRVWGAFAGALADQRSAGGTLAGLYLWKWSVERGGAGAGRGFDLRDKPAQSVLRALAPRD
jgi:hypothetical protein